MATPAALPDTPDAIPGNTLPNMFGTGVAHSTGINQMIFNILQAWTKLGIGASTPAALGQVFRASASGTSGWSYAVPTLLDEEVLSGDAASIVLTVPAASWRTLRVRFTGATKENAASSSFSIQLNADTGSNYYSQRVSSNITTVTAAATNAAGSIVAGNIAGDTGTVGIVEFVVFDYGRTTWKKLLKGEISVQAGVSNGAEVIGQFSGFWNNTAAVTSVTLLSTGGSNLKSGSIAQLIGEP